MALLTDDIHDKLLALLSEEGLVSAEVLAEAEEESKKLGRPLLAILTDKKVVDGELLTHAIAQVSGVPYVNLTNTGLTD